MSDINQTQFFKVNVEPELRVKEVLDTVYNAMREKGYNPVNQIVGYICLLYTSCTVTNMADRKSRQMLHRAKKMNPDAVVVAAGCYVQAAAEEAAADEAIDIIIGNNQKKDLVNILENFRKGEKSKTEC